MATYIRLTDYKSSEEKERGFFDPKNRYEAKQEDFEKIPGSPIAYWVNKKIIDTFQEQKIATYYEIKSGIATGGDEKFLRLWFEASLNKIGLNYKNVDYINTTKKWFPLSKGGEYSKWYGNLEYIIDLENNGLNIQNKSLNYRLRDSKYYFLDSITWSRISSGSIAFRCLYNGVLFGDAGPCIFGDSLNYTMAFLNSRISLYLLTLLNPTINYQAKDISSLPIIFPKNNSIKQKIDQLIQECINISKEEWDSRETSWDFAQNEILRILNDEFLVLNEKPTFETVYNRYCEYWREKFFTLHVNEEELNRLFIDIYELQDELTPDVELKDITILKNEAKILDNELVFQPDEIMKQFISYAVGVMFGRYSLDKEGLQIANLGDDSLVSFMIDETKVSFPIDDDNVIPVLEGEFFGDDIVSRFVKFVEVTFGKEHLRENIEFIESSLGVSLRKYFVKGFYEDHIKRYKKRPIYWMVSSPKKGFMSLIYMHRYSSDIFATVQNGYVREYISKLEAKSEDEQRSADDTSNSPQQRNRASKEVTKISKILDEVIKFDREILTSFAQQRVEIDLDDGVKVNYCKFKEVLYPIKGLCK